jgi:hypothetical protein
VNSMAKRLLCFVLLVLVVGTAADVLKVRPGFTVECPGLSYVSELGKLSKKITRLPLPASTGTCTPNRG